MAILDRLRSLSGSDGRRYSEVLAIIPARGGSRGLPHKNLQSINGVPLLARAILIAKQSLYIKRVIVSTDDENVMEVAKKYGGETIRRPVELSGDQARSESALLHALETLRENEQYVPDLVVFVQCTSPFTISDDLDDAIRVLVKTNADSVFTAIEDYGCFWTEHPSRGVEGMNHDKNDRLPRQMRKPLIRESGSAYVMRTEGFMKEKSRFFGKIAYSPMPAYRAFEIDDPVDLAHARQLSGDLRQRHSLWEIVEKMPFAPRHEQKALYFLARMLTLCWEIIGYTIGGMQFLNRFGRPKIHSK